MNRFNKDVKTKTTEDFQRENRERIAKQRNDAAIQNALNVLFPGKNIYISLEEDNDEYRSFDVKVFEPDTNEDAAFVKENRIKNE